MFGGEFTDANALASLLTVESLLFAALSIAASLSVPASRVRALPLPAQVLGLLAAGFLSIVAFGAAMAWWSIFAVDWPNSFRESTVAITLAIAILGQPVFAWGVACGLRFRP